MTGVRTVEVSAAEAETRLDRWLANRFPNLSHGLVQKLLRTGQVRVNGARATGKFRLSAGQQVRIPPMADSGPRSQDVNSTIDSEDRRVLRSRILYENNELIVIDKPAGMAVQGGTGQRRHVDGLSSVLVAGNEPPPKLVHRLDKDTSGVLLLAKSAKAARRLGREFKMGKVRKTYWAVVVGVPALAAGIIENGLEKRAVAGGERVIVVSNRGRPARTRYKILDQSGSLATLLALYPETGRTHQLRVHCLGLGTPILGDGKYGGRKSFLPDLPAARRLHLHARSMELPIGDGTDLRLVAPMPDHMRASVNQLAFAIDG